MGQREKKRKALPVLPAQNNDEIMILDPPLVSRRKQGRQRFHDSILRRQGPGEMGVRPIVCVCV